MPRTSAVAADDAQFPRGAIATRCRVKVGRSTLRDPRVVARTGTLLFIMSESSEDKDAPLLPPPPPSLVPPNDSIAPAPGPRRRSSTTLGAVSPPSRSLPPLPAIEPILEKAAEACSLRDWDGALELYKKALFLVDSA